jgi:hypothetical protein
MSQLIEELDYPLTVLNPDYSVGPNGIKAPKRSWMLELVAGGLSHGLVKGQTLIDGSGIADDQTSEAYRVLCLMMQAKVFSLWALTTQMAKVLGYELIVEDMGVPREIPYRYRYMYDCILRDAKTLPAGNKDSL